MRREFRVIAYAVLLSYCFLISGCDFSSDVPLIPSN
jgi:hypothetical protein